MTSIRGDLGTGSVASAQGASASADPRPVSPQQFNEVLAQIRTLLDENPLLASLAFRRLSEMVTKREIMVESPAGCSAAASDSSVQGKMHALRRLIESKTGPIPVDPSAVVFRMKCGPQPPPPMLPLTPVHRELIGPILEEMFKQPPTGPRTESDPLIKAEDRWPQMPPKIQPSGSANSAAHHWPKIPPRNPPPTGVGDALAPPRGR